MHSIMADTRPQSPPARPGYQPGELLKQARERLGLAQKDIAAQMNLKIETIDAVEKNDRDRLPIATYVRGYIRSYARLVKMDADELIRLYDEDDSMPPPEVIPNIKKSAQTTGRDKPVRALTYLITFTLALLLLAWLQSRYIVDIKPGTGGNRDNTGQQTTPPVQSPEPHSATAPATVPERRAPVTEQESLSLPADSVDVTESSVSVTAPADASVSTAAPDTGAVQIMEQLTGGDDKIQFLLNSDSWIEVHDANKNMLYHDLARSGKTVSLSGKAPFSVVLGYAPGVTVRFNNEPFDPAPYTSSGIARFTLDTASIRQE